jgi:hypothetical protein
MPHSIPGRRAAAKPAVARPSRRVVRATDQHVSRIAARLVGLARSQMKMSAMVIVAAYRSASLS